MAEMSDMQMMGEMARGVIAVLTAERDEARAERDALAGRAAGLEAERAVALRLLSLADEALGETLGLWSASVEDVDERHIRDVVWAAFEAIKPASRRDGGLAELAALRDGPPAVEGGA